MNIASHHEHRIALRLEVACEFSAVRAAIAQVRGWLEEKNFPVTGSAPVLPLARLEGGFNLCR